MLNSLVTPNTPAAEVPLAVLDGDRLQPDDARSAAPQIQEFSAPMVGQVDRLCTQISAPSCPADSTRTRLRARGQYI